MDKEYKSAVICHFLEFGGSQPWVKDNIHPYSDIYHEYKECSFFSEIEERINCKGFILNVETLLYRYGPRWLFLLGFRWSHDMCGNV